MLTINSKNNLSSFLVIYMIPFFPNLVVFILQPPEERVRETDSLLNYVFSSWMLWISF